MGPPEAPQAVSIGLLLGETAIWHVAAFDGLSLLWHGTSRGRRATSSFLLGFETAIWHFRSATSCFYWASKLLSGTFSAPLKTFKGFKTLPALSFRRPFAALPLGFETAIWQPRGATSCFYWASKLLSGTQQLSTAFRCFAIGPGNPEAPRTVSVGLRNCYLAPSSFRRPFAALPSALPRPHELFLGFETAIWHFRSATSCFYIGLRNCYLARFQHPLKPSKPSQQLSTAFGCFAMGPPRRHKLFLLGFETAIWHVAAFDGLSLLCHGTSRGRHATSCFCWASKLLSGTFSAPLKTLKIPNTLNPGSSFRRAFDGLSSTTSDNIK